MLLLRKTFEAAEAAFFPVTFLAIALCVYFLFIETRLSGLFVFRYKKARVICFSSNILLELFKNPLYSVCLMFVIFPFFVEFNLFLF